MALHERKLIFQYHVELSAINEFGVSVVIYCFKPRNLV